MVRIFTIFSWYRCKRENFQLHTEHTQAIEIVSAAKLKTQILGAVFFINLLSYNINLRREIFFSWFSSHINEMLYKFK